MKKVNAKLVVLYALDWLFLLAPLGIVMFINRDIYFIKQEGIKLSIGCMMALVVGVCLSLGKLKEVKAVIWCLILTFISYFLQAILQDLTLILGAATIGLMFDYVFKILINNTKTKRGYIQQATYQSEAMKEVVGVVVNARG